MFAVITPALISGAIADRVKFWSWTLFVALWVDDRLLPGGALGVLLRRVRRRGRGRRLDRQRRTSWARSTSPVAPRCTSTPVRRASRWPSCSASGAAGRASRCGRTTCRSCCSARACCGSAGSGSTRAPRSRRVTSPASPSPTRWSPPAAAVLGWLIVEQIRDGKPTTLGAASGAVAGLVAITPACGFVSLARRVAIGVDRRCVVCALAVALKFRFGFDDSLDVVGVHLVGGLDRHPADRVLRHHQRQLAGAPTASSTAAAFDPAGQAGGGGGRGDGLLVRRHGDPGPGHQVRRSASGSPTRPRSPASTRPSTRSRRTTSRPCVA